MLRLLFGLVLKLRLLLLFRLGFALEDTVVVVTWLKEAAGCAGWAVIELLVT